jgi:hypothetical protein
VDSLNPEVCLVVVKERNGQMKNYRMLLVCAVTVIIVVSLLIIYDCLRPKSLDAQTCVSVIPQTTITTYSGGSCCSQPAGCHNYCAIGGAWGMDDRGSEGFSVDQQGSCGNGKFNWWINVGGDVDGFKIYCMDISN